MSSIPLPDELQVLELRHCVWLLPRQNPVLQAAAEGPLNLTSDYDCGHDSTLNIFVNRNVTDTFTDTHSTMPDLGLSSSDVPDLLSLDFGGANDPIQPETPLVRDNEALASDENAFKKLLGLLGEQTDTAQSLNIGVNLTSPHAGGGMKGPNTGDVSQAGAEQYMELLNKAFESRQRCGYDKLRVLEESSNILMSRFHFEFLVQDAEYPVLGKGLHSI